MAAGEESEHLASCFVAQRRVLERGQIEIVKCEVAAGDHKEYRHADDENASEAQCDTQGDQIQG